MSKFLFVKEFYFAVYNFCYFSYLLSYQPLTAFIFLH
nr:MAG TPA: hypothetical protein [Caudoviricetes sp.]